MILDYQLVGSNILMYHISNTSLTPWSCNDLVMTSDPLCRLWADHVPYSSIKETDCILSRHASWTIRSISAYSIHTHAVPIISSILLQSGMVYWTVKYHCSEWVPSEWEFKQLIVAIIHKYHSKKIWFFKSYLHAVMFLFRTIAFWRNLLCRNGYLLKFRVLCSRPFVFQICNCQSTSTTDFLEFIDPTTQTFNTLSTGKLFNS